jgi:hypothetical protein
MEKVERFSSKSEYFAAILSQGLKSPFWASWTALAIWVAD